MGKWIHLEGGAGSWTLGLEPKSIFSWSGCLLRWGRWGKPGVRVLTRSGINSREEGRCISECGA